MRTCTPAAGTSPRRASEQGSALVWAMFFVSLTTGLLVAHSFEMSANRRTMDTRYRRLDVAKSVAESGLTEATAYMRRQPNQPVVEFAPQLDPEADPPLNETLDPGIGLVREFEVQGSLWGRYEVRKSEAIDVSASYGEPAGSVWDVGARGYLYEVADKNKPFDKAPNRVVSVQTIRTEVRGLPIETPANAAIVMLDPSRITMDLGGKIGLPGSPAIAYRAPVLPLPLPVLDISIIGTPAALPLPNLTIDLQSVFGMRGERLRNLADVVLLSPRQITGRVIRDQAIYAPQSLTLQATNSSLRGRMLLVVGGDFTAMAGNNSDFSGLLYAAGDVRIEGPFRFRGTMIVGGLLKVGGSGDVVDIAYDGAEVQGLQQAMARYRMSRDVRPAPSSGAFVAPDDLLKDLDAVVK
jgi:hypothetical protein